MPCFEENPFAQPTIDDPFTDIAIQELVINTSTQIRIDDYNPFAKNEVQKLSSKDEIKPILSTTALLKKQEELELKEKELAKLEEEIKNNNSYNVRHNNWPPLYKNCYFQPCFYQDIDLDIPLEFQKIVRNLYFLWTFHAILLILNVICGIIIVNFTIIGWGVMFLLMFTPFSYLCWFRTAYKAFRSDSSFNFMLFFFVFFFQCCVTTIQAIGIPGSGTVGIVIALQQFDNSVNGVFIGSFALFVATGFGCAAAADLYLISKIHRVYRSSGASFAKAQAEFFQSPNCRTTVSEFASATLQSLIYKQTNR